MPMRRGADARISIDGVFCALNRFEVSDRSSSINVTNTEGIPGSPADSEAARGYAAKIPDIAEGTIRVTFASYDDDNDPFAGSLHLESGVYYPIQVYPTGSGESHNYGSLLCTEVTHSGSVPGPQPVTATFESDGLYTVLGG